LINFVPFPGHIDAVGLWPSLLEIASQTLPTLESKNLEFVQKEMAMIGELKTKINSEADCMCICKQLKQVGAITCSYEQD
jgi:hypothetical protein